MFLTLTPDADAAGLQRALTEMGIWTTPLQTGHRLGLSVLPHSVPVAPERLEALRGIDTVFRGQSAHPLVDSTAHGAFIIRNVSFNIYSEPVLIMGPCAVESEAQIDSSAEMASRAGARFLRGGAFKPRTSPYSFSGHGAPALGWLRRAADREGLGVVTEALSETTVEVVAEVADIVQIGSRNMQNFALLKAVGQTGRPALLKRGIAATIEEWLCAGEHLMAAGCPVVLFCERGVRGFDPLSRNLLDLAAVALLRQVYGLPVVVDPSHAVGRRDLILPLAQAGLAAGAVSLLIEAHPDAGAARSDGPQALGPNEIEPLSRLLGGERPVPFGHPLIG